jgi:hypothetical protein
MVHDLGRVYGLRAAICLSAVLIGGCVELPGIYYKVLMEERPSESDCVKLSDALTAKLDLQLRPSPYPCFVTLDSGGSDPPRNVVVTAYFRQRRIVVEINEFRLGSATVPSPSTQLFAQQIGQIVQDQFPTARLLRFTEKRGPIGP